MTTNHTPTPLQLAVKNLEGQCSYAFSRGNKSLSIRLDEGREILRLVRERDELVAALRGLLDSGNINKGYRAGFTADDPWIEWPEVVAARAALAKVSS